MKPVCRNAMKADEVRLKLIRWLSAFAAEKESKSRVRLRLR